MLSCRLWTDLSCLMPFPYKPRRFCTFPCLPRRAYDSAQIFKENNDDNHQGQTMTAAVALQRPALWQIPQPQAEVFARLPEKTAQLRARLQAIDAQFQRVKFASSLAVEDMVITDQLARLAAPVEVFMLETGRLNAETLAYAEVVRARYPALDFRLYHPDAQEVAEYVETHGLNAFYQSVELRKRCCYIRKVAPPCRRRTRRAASPNSIRFLTGRRTTSGRTSSKTPFLSTNSITRAIQASAANRARLRSRQARTSAPAAGGGKTKTAANADYTNEVRYEEVTQ